MATAAELTITMTMRLPRGMKDELDALARSTGRKREALVQEALRRFIDVQRWPIAGIAAGIREADAGIFVGDDERWTHCGRRSAWSPTRRASAIDEGPLDTARPRCVPPPDPLHRPRQPGRRTSGRDARPRCRS